MGIFNIFKFSNKKSQPNPNAKRDLIKSYEKLKQETERLRTENEKSQLEFNKIIDLRNKAEKLEKSGKYLEAIESYLKSVDYGEKSPKLSISNYVHDIDRIIILYGKTKETENQITFLQRVIGTYPDYRDVNKWEVRLSGLMGRKRPTKDFKQSNIVKPNPSKPTIGAQNRALKNTLREFNFYYDLPAGMETFEYIMREKIFTPEKSKEMRKFKDSFQLILSEAKIAENEGDYKRAIETYEKLIVEEYEGREPFERLMIIYRKLKWKESEINIIERAIAFFENLREVQKSNVLFLARKYNMESKAMEYIDGNKKIQYYGGSFDLYSPNPTIEKWKLKLEKLQKN